MEKDDKKLNHEAATEEKAKRVFSVFYAIEDAIPEEARTRDVMLACEMILANCILRIKECNISDGVSLVSNEILTVCNKLKEARFNTDNKDTNYANS